MDVKELEIEKDVLKRIEMICRFCNVKPIIKCGSINKEEISKWANDLGYKKEQILHATLKN